MTVNVLSPFDNLLTPPRIAVLNDVEPRDWQQIFARISRCGGRSLTVCTILAAAGATLVGLFGSMALLALAMFNFVPDISSWALACFIIPPSFLSGAAVGQMGGNIFLRIRLGLDEVTRRGFAARLTLGRVPASWPNVVRRWLFTGDWLGAPACDARFPYMRIFILGEAPEHCKDEEAIWAEIQTQICGEVAWESGSSHREISYPSVLPEWARQVSRGDGIKELVGRIGQRAAEEWVSHLWRRACRQWPALSGPCPSAQQTDSFELHYLSLSGNREALVVVLRPAGVFSDAAMEAQPADAAPTAVHAA